MQNLITSPRLAKPRLAHPMKNIRKHQARHSKQQHYPSSANAQLKSSGGILKK